MRIYGLFLLTILGLSACGTQNMYMPKSGATESEPLRKASAALQKGEASHAVSFLLTQLPEKSQEILQNFSAEDSEFIANLKASLSGFSKAKEYITLLGAAFSQEAGVNSIDIAGKLLKIQKSPTALQLTCAAKNIAEYFVVVSDMNIDFNNPKKFLDRLWQSNLMWNAFAEHDDKNLFMLITINEFVILLADIKTFDTNHDNKISREEADKMTTANGVKIYSDIILARNSLSVYNYLSEDMLDKTVAKFNKYIDEMGVTSADSDEIKSQKVKAYLVNSTGCLL